MQYLSDVFLNVGEAHKRAVAVGIMAVILLKAYFDADSVRDDVLTVATPFTSMMPGFAAAEAHRAITAIAAIRILFM